MKSTNVYSLKGGKRKEKKASHVPRVLSSLSKMVLLKLTKMVILKRLVVIR